MDAPADIWIVGQNGAVRSPDVIYSDDEQALIVNGTHL
jgi:hypothetical protein